MTKSINGLLLEDLVYADCLRTIDSKLKFEDLLFPKPKCTDCGETLTEENWSPSHRKKKIHLCKVCSRERSRRYYQQKKQKLRK